MFRQFNILNLAISCAFLLVFAFSKQLLAQISTQTTIIKPSNVENNPEENQKKEQHSNAQNVLPKNSATSAKIAGFTITAESLDRDFQKGVVNLNGNVVIIYQNKVLKADAVTIDLRRKQAILKGNVTITSLDSTIGGDEIQIDYLSNQALIYNGYIQSSNVRFQGSFIEQTSENKFYVTNAEYTTCTNCPSTWSFKGSQIKAELGGYAFIKNSLLKISDIPVFWLPYLIVPLKNERQTGLLFPEFGYLNNRGMFLAQSFFYVNSRSDDYTVTLKNYEHGGLKELLEYRYVLKPNSYGQVNVSHFNDRVFQVSSQLNTYRNENNQNSAFTRWSAQAYTQHEFSDDIISRTKINLISDLQYPKDFSDEFPQYASSALENQLSISQSHSNSLGQFNLVYFKHLLASDPLSSNNMAVHKLPEIKYDVTDTQFSPDSPYYYSLNLEYARFERARKWDDMSTYNANGNEIKYVSNSKNNPSCEHDLDSNCNLTTDNTFNSGLDQYRTGQRALINASFSRQAVYPVDSIALFPRLTLSDAEYFFDYSDQKYNSRKDVKLDLVSRSKFFKVFDTPDNEFKYKHEFIPEVSYTYIPVIQQEAHPFFGNYANGEKPFSSNATISDSDINSDYGLQFDHKDRIYDRHLVTMTLLNRVIRKDKQTSAYKNILDFRLSQSYDLYQLQDKNVKVKQPLSDLSSTLTYSYDDFVLQNQSNYYPYVKAVNSSTYLSYLNAHQQYFKIGYLSKRTEKPYTDDVLLAMGFVTNYINVLAGFMLDTSSQRTEESRLKQFSLITQLKPPGECWSVNLYRDQKVGLDAEWRIRFDFTFDGKPPKVIPPEELTVK